MRLICPNCSAQYEVDGSMIPDDGRDVQCSNCGHTWFELPDPSRQAAPKESTPIFSEDDFDEEDVFDAPPPYDLDDDDSFEDDVQAESKRAQTTPDFLSRAEFEDDEDLPEPDTTLWDDDTTDEEPERSEDERTSAAVRAVTSAAIDAKAEEAESEAAADTSEESEPSDMDEEPASDDPWDDEFAESEASDDDDEVTPAPAAAGRPRRPADAAALDILREEAERELSQRRAPDSGSLEMQTDLGLGDIRRRRTPSRALRARMAHLGEEAPDDFEDETLPEEPKPDPNKTRLAQVSDRTSEDDDDAYEEPKRDLLPDIDEINSTLRKPVGHPGDIEAARRSGFRIAFLLMVFLTAAAIFAYAQAPAIARALPNSEAAIISYVDWANGIRDWIDSLIAG